MKNKPFQTISGMKDGARLDSRVLEEEVQKAVASGCRNLEIQAYGQHGIGGRLWRAEGETVYVRITGHPGQRIGSMGFPNTFIELMGPASDDVGWLNAGASIVVHGNAANGAANAMAQGKIYVAGNLGARGMTMTKHNPRFEPPELWVLGSVGDYFGEFMAGGVAVVCGHEAQNPKNVLGYRPLVGMVGGRVFVRGPHEGFSRTDAKPVPVSDGQWQWLTENLSLFLETIGRPELTGDLSERSQWQLLEARSSRERTVGRRRTMGSFRAEAWDRELGKGGLIGDLTDIDRSPIPLINTGLLRRFVPVWENRKYLAPCEATCPTGIPVHERWRLVREGRMDEAVDLALSYTPLPATVCGYLCPNLCMEACTKRSGFLPPVDVTVLGKASIRAKLPELPEESGRRIAVIGGGPAGLSVAWQLRRGGHSAVVFDTAPELGGKISSVIPESRIPAEVVEAELDRIRKAIPHVHLHQRLGRDDLERLREDYDMVVIAAGAQTPRSIPIPGKERAVPALEFLSRAKTDNIRPGKKVVIVGAGNVGCDVASEAVRLGAETVTLIDIQEPASFGKERKAAEKAGAVFRWPVFSREINEAGVVLQDGETLAADTVVMAIGDQPDLSFLPRGVEIERGFVKVNELYQSTDPKIFAVGDAVRPGLLTDAIGSGRKAAAAILELLQGRLPALEGRTVIPRDRVKLAYFDPRVAPAFGDMARCASQCSSCGACRDCGICVAICPEAAIGKVEGENGTFEYRVDEDRCIGCGFCAGACPCGVWNLMENRPLE